MFIVMCLVYHDDFCAPAKALSGCRSDARPALGARDDFRAKSHRCGHLGVTTIVCANAEP
jgi:hypothetical protein